MTTIQVAHSSGKWDRTASKAFDVSVRKMRHDHSIVTRTEATAPTFSSELTAPGDGWGHWHPRGLGENCSVEWDLDVWSLVDKGALQLTDIRIHTKKGFQQPPVALTWTVLLHKATDVQVEIGAAHLDLANTALRRQANLEECHSLRTHYQHSHQANPHRHHLIQFDGNRNQKFAANRAYFAKEAFGGTDMRSGWHPPLPAQGTHGKALLDLSVADFALTSRLLPDDASSDHRPYASTGKF